MMETTRILLAEDHNTVREGIKMLVNAQPDMEVIGEADNGIAASARGSTRVSPATSRPAMVTGFNATNRVTATTAIPNTGLS